jgi:nucleoid DNA-binding protein
MYVAGSKLSMSQPNTSIWDDVKSLLHRHDCVIVPGFGGFVCNREAARIDQVSHQITPPSRKVIFNQNLKVNDGLLAGHISQQHGITYSQAIQLIDEAVQDTLRLLQEKKQLAIDLFGNFRLNADANYVFLPDKRNNYLMSSYGLGLIQAQPVASRTVKAVRARTFKDRKEPKTMKPERRRNVWPAVLIGVLTILLTLNGYIFLSDHAINDLHIGTNNTMSIASWFDSLRNKPSAEPQALPAVTAGETTAEPVAETPVPTHEEPAAPAVTEETPAQAATDPYAALYAFATHFEALRGTIYFPQPPADEPVAVTEEQPAEMAEAPAVVSRPAAKQAHSHSVLSTKGIASGYYVIGGVFCKERNAKKYLGQLQESGYEQAELLLNEDINCKRVSYQHFNSRKEAEQFCHAIQSSANPTAWVLAVQ